MDSRNLPPGWLSPNFSLAELTVSQTAARRGIDNTPRGEALDNLSLLAEWLERLRELLGGHPILVSSGFRSVALNTAVKGSRTSLHMFGLAADFTVPRYGSPLDVCRAIEAEKLLAFHELIYEGTWVHVGLSCPRGLRSGQLNERRVMTAEFVRGRRTTYSPGLPA